MTEIKFNDGTVNVNLKHGATIFTDLENKKTCIEIPELPLDQANTDGLVTPPSQKDQKFIMFDDHKGNKALQIVKGDPEGKVSQDNTFAIIDPAFNDTAE